MKECMPLYIVFLLEKWNIIIEEVLYIKLKNNEKILAEISQNKGFG